MPASPTPRIARISQIMGLNSLAPSIQEALLRLPAVDGPEPVTERQLRPIAAASHWTEPWALWENLRV